MEEEFQSFRLSGTTTIVKIPVFQVQEFKVIFWDDIQQFFPRLMNVKKGDVAITHKRDSNHIRCEKQKDEEYGTKERSGIFYSLCLSLFFPNEYPLCLLG